MTCAAVVSFAVKTPQGLGSRFSQALSWRWKLILSLGLKCPAKAAKGSPAPRMISAKARLRSSLQAVRSLQPT